MNVLQHRLGELARDVGRLSRRLDEESYDGFLVHRIAEHVETLDCLLEPTAHDLYIEQLASGVDEAEAIGEALSFVDARTTELRRALELTASAVVPLRGKRHGSPLASA